MVIGINKRREVAREGRWKKAREEEEEGSVSSQVSLRSATTRGHICRWYRERERAAGRCTGAGIPHRACVRRHSGISCQCGNERVRTRARVQHATFRRPARGGSRLAHSSTSRGKSGGGPISDFPTIGVPWLGGRERGREREREMRACRDPKVARSVGSSRGYTRGIRLRDGGRS